MDYGSSSRVAQGCSGANCLLLGAWDALLMVSFLRDSQLYYNAAAFLGSSNVVLPVPADRQAVTTCPASEAASNAAKALGIET